MFSLQPGLFDFGDSSLRRAAFVFVLKLKSSNDVEQFLTRSYAKQFRLLKRIQCCCNVLPYLSTLGSPHSHIMFQLSPLEIFAFTSG